jgi:hypothetical protein
LIDCQLRPETQHHDLFGQRDGGFLDLVKVQITRPQVEDEAIAGRMLVVV